MPAAAAHRLHGCILTPQGFVRGAITVRDGRIDRIQGDAVPEDQARTSNLPLLLPGFIDLHVHGGGGHDTMAGGDAIADIARTHARHGTTALLATTMTAPRDEIEAALRGLAPHVHTRPSGGAPASSSRTSRSSPTCPWRTTSPTGSAACLARSGRGGSTR